MDDDDIPFPPPPTLAQQRAHEQWLWDYERTQAKRKKREAVRKPPMPPWMAKGIPGICRWCGLAIEPLELARKRGRMWHRGRPGEPADCLTEFKIVTTSEGARDACRARDGGRCVDCRKIAVSFHQGRDSDGTPAWQWWGEGKERRWITLGNWCHLYPIEAWEADHARPLWSLTDSERLEIKWWQLGNLVTRCTDCHDNKSGKEAATRAKIKRLRLKNGLDKPQARIPF